MASMQSFAYLLTLLTFLLKVNAVTICNATQSCPEDLPCCSQGGQCGTGQYCLGCCNPSFSFNIDSCMPLPICKDSSTKFDNYSSKILNEYTFLGNVSAADWLYSGNIIDYADENSLILAMPKNSGGTVLTSTRAVWYGKITARMKASHLGGVITAFILFSGIQDEIDFEFVGADIEKVQTNYYWQGTLNYNHSTNITVDDVFDDYHTYELDWHEDYITWSVDGTIGRTLYKNETYNSTTDTYRFPQTPSQVHLSIWPGGNATNAPGTIAWAGGEINWDAPDISDPGYYYAIVNEVNITCYDPPIFAKKNGTKAYKYTNSDNFLEKSIMITDDEVMLGSDEATGNNITEGVTTSSSSSSSSASSSSSSSSSAKKTSSASTTGKTSSGSSGSSTSTSSSSSSSSSSTNSKNDAPVLSNINIVTVFSFIFGLLI